jgi:hypothetical protein
MFTIEFWVTMALMALGAGLGAGMVRLERKVREGFRPKLLPTTLIMLMGGIVAFMAAVHLSDLLKPVLWH